MRNKFVLALSSLLLLSGLTAQAHAQSGAGRAEFENCLNHFAHQTPPKLNPMLKYEARESFALCFEEFATYNVQTGKATIFAAEMLNAKRLSQADEKRTDRFYEEARLPHRARAELDAYRGSQMDRGHLAAAANMSTPNGMAQSFSLANMSPQTPELNRGLWNKQVESATRKYVKRIRQDVYVITGVHYSEGLGKARKLKGEVAVGTHWFKLVYTPASNRAWAFWANNDSDTIALERISYEQLVVRTQTEWLPGRNPPMQ